MTADERIPGTRIAVGVIRTLRKRGFTWEQIEGMYPEVPAAALYAAVQSSAAVEKED